MKKPGRTSQHPGRTSPGSSSGPDPLRLPGQALLPPPVPPGSPRPPPRARSPGTAPRRVPQGGHTATFSPQERAVPSLCLRCPARCPLSPHRGPRSCRRSPRRSSPGPGGPCAAPAAQPGTMREGKGGAGSAAAAGAVPGGSPWRPGLPGGGCPSYSRRETWIKGSAGTGQGQPTSSSSAPTGAGCSSPASTATVSWGRGAISPARRRRPPAPWQRRLR